MAALTRDDLIESLMRVIIDACRPADLLGYVTSTWNEEFALARTTLNAYSMPMLIELHMMQVEDDERKANVLQAKSGRSEEWVRTYLALTYADDEMFSDRLHYAFNSDTATTSLSLYPTLKFEDTDEYYEKATALTKVVLSIQFELHENEGFYGRYFQNANPRLISYSIDPADEEGDDRLARIASDDLVELILSRPEDWERIAIIVVERETDDVELIVSILDASPVHDLAKGVL
jgi:hypothetical protein